MRRKILLDMYLNKNLGDDLFLKIIAERYPNIDFYACPMTNYAASKLPENVRARRSIFTRALNLLLKRFHRDRFNRLKKRSSAMVTLGGSMFMERQGANSQELKEAIDEKFNQVKIPYYVLGANFGPYRNNFYIESYKKIFAKAEDVCFREKYSKTLFKELSSVRTCPDLVFSFDAKKYQTKSKKEVAISVIDLTNREGSTEHQEAYESKIAEMVKFFLGHGYRVNMLSFCRNEGDERAIKRILKNNQLDKERGVKVCKYRGNVDETLECIARSEYVIASRFHATVLGMVFGKKVLPIIYSDKISHMLEDTEFDGVSVKVKDICNFDLSKSIEKIKKAKKTPTRDESLGHFKELDQMLLANDNEAKQPETRRHKELLKNTVIIMLGRFATQFMSLLLLPLYTNTLAASDYGTVDLVMTYITLFAPVITIQQEMATFRYLVEARGDKAKIQQVFSTSAIKMLSRISIASVFYLVVCQFIQFKYQYLILGAAVACAISSLLLQATRGLGKNTKYSIASVISGGVTLISNVVLLCIFKLGGESLLISMILANLACSAYLLISMKLHRYLSAKSYDRASSKAMLKYSWPLVPNGISWWAINASDRTIISIFLGAAANGIYAAANKVSAITSGLIGVFSLAWTESASVHISEKDHEEFFSSIANKTLCVFSSICGFIIACLPFVFDLVIGPNYREAYNYIPIFIIGSVFNCIVTIYSAIYVAKKLTKKVASTSILAAAINILVNLILVHFIGLYAAAISTAVAYLLMAIYRHFDLRKYVKIGYKKSSILIMGLSLLPVTTGYYLDSWALKAAGLAVAVICCVASIAIDKIAKKR